MITTFGEYIKKPDINSVSNEFWKMVRIANWNTVIKGYKENPIIDQTHKDFLQLARFRIYSKFSLNEIRKFREEYDVIYFQLYDWFFSTFSEGNFNLSDDGYTDFISSIIGKGKTFIKKCIKNNNLVLEMAKSEDYAESFLYLLVCNERLYDDIKAKYDPFFRDVRKYNL